MAFSSQLKPPLALNCSSLNVFTATHMHFFEIKECGKLCPISPNCCVATVPLQPVLPTCLLEVSIVKWVWETLLAFVSSGLFLLHSLNLMMNFFLCSFFSICLRLLLDLLITGCNIEFSCEELPVAISSVDGSLKGKLSFITPDISMNWYHSKIYEKKLKKKKLYLILDKVLINFQSILHYVYQQQLLEMCTQLTPWK